jgi:uncharacterized Ntn-hydrolase superfamily protein
MIRPMVTLPLMAMLFAPFPGAPAANPDLPPAASRVPIRPVHTYSIVARDPNTGEMGVAVQSHWFSVGSLVAWAEAGVGAVATQSIIDPSYGPLGLDLMRAGKSAREALTALVAADSNADLRQVAMVDARGGSAAHTGEHCILEAGHVVRDGFTTQANLMEKDTVWTAMARAFEQASGDLAERLMAALKAAEAEGGDIRGRQSAAILVVAGASTGRPWVDRRFDLRVEDSDDPLGELERLLRLPRAYRHMDEGDNLFAGGDVDGAVREYGTAERMVPENTEMLFWHAITLANAERIEEALPLFERVFADPERGGHWAALVSRLPHSNMLPDDAALIEQILAARP